jgi:hypothetical protein
MQHPAASVQRVAVHRWPITPEDAMTFKLRFLNFILHALHVIIISFIAFGWMIPNLRKLHLAFVLMTLATWVILGYCPLTELHWWVRRKANLRVVDGPYIPFVVEQLTHRPVDSKRLDRIVVVFTVLVALASAISNANWLF